MILITGFEPFTTGKGFQVDVNPTAEIATGVASQDPKLASAILPVSFADTKSNLLALFDSQKPKAWIGLGYAPHRTTLDIEAIAINKEHAPHGDNVGDSPCNRAIIENAPLAYQTKLNLSRAQETLSGLSVPVQTSFHAGTYLCNQVFYLGCHHTQTSPYLEIAGFIHVPPMQDFKLFEQKLAHFALQLAHATS